MRTPVKNFRFSAQGVFQVSETAKMGTLVRVLVHEVQLKRHNFGWWESFRASRHPKDVPFVREFWWRDVRFGRYKPTKTHILAIAAVDYTANDVTQSNAFDCVSF